MSTPHLVLCELPDANLPRHESHSSECLKAHRALQLCGFTYDRLHGDRPDAFRRYNPAGQVPVLLIEGKPLSDSTDIVSRIDALSDGVLTRGLTAFQRAEAFLWEEMADTVLVGFLTAAHWIDEDNWPKTRSAFFGTMSFWMRVIAPFLIRRRIRRALIAGDVIRPTLDACWVRFEETLDRLEARAPARAFWLGDTPSRADVAIFAPLWSLRTELTQRQARALAARPRLSAWLLRVDRACTQSLGPPDYEDAPPSCPAPEDSGVHRLAASFG
jgi:glutathione S-transferase